MSPGLIGGAALLVLALGGGLVQRQCTVMELDDEIEALEDRVERSEGEANRLRKDLARTERERDELFSANELLAAAAQRQSELASAFEAAMREQGEAARAEQQRHADAISREKATSAWLRGQIGRQNEAVKPGECEAAVAATLVRDALRGALK